MFQKFKDGYKKPMVRDLLDPTNAGLYIFVVIVVALTWSAVGVVQSNFKLEKQISKGEQEISVQELENQNQKLKNEYYKSDEYLELSARKQFGKAAPGEKVITVPHDVALKHAAQLPDEEPVKKAALPDDRSGAQKNLQDWLDYFTHRLSE